MPIHLIDNEYGLPVQYQGPRNRQEHAQLSSYLVNKYPLPNYKWAYITCRNVMSVHRLRTGVCQTSNYGYRIKVALGDDGKFRFDDLSCLIVLAHEYRHAMQCHDRIQTTNKERDADDFAYKELPIFLEHISRPDMLESFMQSPPPRPLERYYLEHERPVGEITKYGVGGLALSSWSSEADSKIADRS